MKNALSAASLTAGLLLTSTAHAAPPSGDRLQDAVTTGVVCGKLYLASRQESDPKKRQEYEAAAKACTRHVVFELTDTLLKPNFGTHARQHIVSSSLNLSLPKIGFSFR